MMSLRGTSRALVVPSTTVRPATAYRGPHPPTPSTLGMYRLRISVPSTQNPYLSGSELNSTGSLRPISSSMDQGTRTEPAEEEPPVTLKDLQKAVSGLVTTVSSLVTSVSGLAAAVTKLRDEVKESINFTAPFICFLFTMGTYLIKLLLRKFMQV